MESLEAHLTTLQSAWEAFSNSVVKSEFVKLFLSAGTGTLKALNTDLGVLTTQFGLLWGVLTGGLTIGTKMVKNVIEGIAAVKKFGITLQSIGLAAPIAAAAIAAVTVAVINGVSAWKEYDEVVNGAVKRYNESLQENEAQTKKQIFVLSSTREEALRLVDQLDKLENSTDNNVESQQQYALIVEQLNGLIPDLGLIIDGTTGKLNQETDALRAQIDQWYKLDEAQAYAFARQNAMQARVDLKSELDSQNKSLEELNQKLKDLRQEYGDEVALDPENLLAAIISPFTKIGQGRREYQQTLQDIKNLEKGIKNTQKAYEESEEEYNRLALEQQSLSSKNSKETDETFASSKPKTTFKYVDWLKEQKHLVNTGKLLERDFYASLQAMLNKYTDKSIISTEERWEAEEEIYKYQQNLTKEQQQAYEKAVRDAESAAKAKAQAEKQAISDIKTAFTAWQDEQDYLLTTGQITESEYYDNLKAKNDELFKDKEDFLSQYWTNLEKIYKWEQQQIEDQKKAKVTEFDEWLKAQDHALAMGEISEEEYYTELKRKNDEYFKDSTENLDKYWKNEESWYKWKKQQIEEIHEAAKAALDAEIEKEKQRLELKKTEAETRKAQLEAQQDEIERLADYVQTIADAEIGKIDEKISALKDEADAITAKYKEQIDALEEQNQAIDDQISKQKLLEALAKAQQSKKYVFKDGRFQYVDDVDAIASAQEQLDEFNREQALQEKTKQLEKQRDLELEQNQLAQKALEDEKKRWEEYKQGWSNITNAYTEQQNALLAQQKLGIDVEKATWDERLSNLESFKNQYISLAAQIKAAEAEIAGYDAQISAVGSAENQDATIRRMMKENSEAWHQTSDASERERLHEMNEYLNSLLSNKGTYNAASGQWSNLSYTQSQPLSSSIGSVGVMTPSVASSAVLGSSLINKGISGVKQALSQIFNMGNISLPNVSNAKQFVSELKNMALQAAYSRA